MNRSPLLLMLGTAALCVTALGYWLGWRRGMVVEPDPAIAPALTKAAPTVPPAISSPPAKTSTDAPPLTLEEAWKDIVSALEKANASGDNKQTEELTSRLQTLTTADLAGLLKRMNEEWKGSAMIKPAWSTVVNLFSARDPAAAFALVVAPFAPGQVPGAASLVFERWGDRDPATAWQAARTWLGQPPSGTRLPRSNPPVQERIVSRFFQRWAARDFDAAYQAWRETTEPSLRADALRGLSFSPSTEAEHERFFKRLQNEPPSTETTEAMAAVVGRWSGHSSLAAMSARLDTLDLPREDKAALERAAAFGAAPSDPPAAIAWLLARNAPERRATDIAEMVRSWSQAAPNACGEWLTRQPPGPGIDPAIASFANEVSGVDPESALAWSQRITDPQSRRSTARLVFQQWHDRAPAQALAQALTLPPSEREWLESFVKK